MHHLLSLGFTLISVGPISCAAASLDPHHCGRLMESHLELYGTDHVGLTSLANALRGRTSARVLVRVAQDAVRARTLRAKLGLSQTQGTRIPDQFRVNRREGHFAVIAGEADAVAERLRDLGRLYGADQIRGQILQAVGPILPRPWDLGTKIIPLSGYDVGDALADLEVSGVKAATLYDVDFLSANFALPHHVVASISEEDFEDLGIHVVATFDRLKFRDEPVVKHFGSFTLFSGRAFRRLKNITDAQTGNMSILSPALATALDQCVGPMCDVTREITKTDLTSTAPAVDRRAGLKPESWIEELGREPSIRAIVSEARAWYSRSESAGLIGEDERLYDPRNKAFVRKLFALMWTHLLPNWVKPDLTFNASAAPGLAGHTSTEISKAWLEFYDSWKKDQAHKMGLKDVAPERAPTTEVPSSPEEPPTSPPEEVIDPSPRRPGPRPNIFADQSLNPIVPAETRRRMLDFFNRHLDLDAELEIGPFSEVITKLIKLVAPETSVDRVRAARQFLQEHPWTRSSKKSFAEWVGTDAAAQSDLRHAWTALAILLDQPRPGATIHRSDLDAVIRDFGARAGLVREEAIKASNPRPIRIQISARDTLARKVGLTSEDLTAAMGRWHGFVFPAEPFSKGREWTVLFATSPISTKSVRDQLFLALLDGDEVIDLERYDNEQQAFFSRVVGQLGLRSRTLPTSLTLLDMPNVPLFVEAWKLVEFQALRGISPAMLAGLLRRATVDKPSDPGHAFVTDPLTGETFMLAFRYFDQYGRNPNTFVLKNIVPLNLARSKRWAL